MPAARTATKAAAKTAGKTTSTPRRAPVKKAAPARRHTALDDVPPELRNFYETAKAAPTPDGDLDFHTGDADPVETEKLFSLDGVEYRVPVEFTPHLAMVFLDAATHDSEWVAVGRLLKSVIGDDGWKALVGFKGLRPEDLQAVLNKVMVKVMGALEGVAKN